MQPPPDVNLSAHPLRHPERRSQPESKDLALGDASVWQSEMLRQAQNDEGGIEAPMKAGVGQRFLDAARNDR